jgi:hypothetical protein
MEQNQSCNLKWIKKMIFIIKIIIKFNYNKMKILFLLSLLSLAYGNSLRGSANDYIPINQHDTFFISYKNGVRKDVKYENRTFIEMN